MDQVAAFFSDNCKHQDMEDLLHTWCAINSGTDHLDGLHQMQLELTKAFGAIADETSVIPFDAITSINMQGEMTLQAIGNALWFRKRPHLTSRVLLTGHMDTVYPVQHIFQTLTYLSANKLNGPGVADMKGGLIVMLYALKAFEQTPLAQFLGWDVFINADEEIGSLASSQFFTQLKHPYLAGLVYEPAMDDIGTLAKNRKGSGKFTLKASGRAAHAGRAFDEGRNAICHLACAIEKIHQLNGMRPGVTLNIGKIAGGQALNVVPDTAVAKIDVRITHASDGSWVMQQLERILTELKKEDYQLILHGEFSRPVKQVAPNTCKLFERLQQVARTLNLTLGWQDSGGCCDGNNLAAQGLAVLDTLGVRGGRIHSVDEYILLDSLTERAHLSAQFLINLAQHGLEESKR